MKVSVRVIETGRDLRVPMLSLLGQIAKGVGIKVGVITGTHSSGMSNDALAAIHEFGTEDGRVPERSFLRSTMNAQRKPWLDFMASRMRKVVAGTIPALQAVEQMGLKMSGDVKATIVAGIDPENAPATIAATGSSTPLIDTGQLKESIAHQVIIGKVPA